MKQILQNLRSGKMELAELPSPKPGRGEVLIQTRASLISVGTEKMLVEFSRANLIQKARQQPDKVRQVLDKIKTDGLMPTLDAVFRKLDQPLPLGYCNAGVALEVGAGVNDLRPGDRIASNGHHAEIVCVPRNLCARIPDNVTNEQAAFTVMGAIALQGMRLAEPTFGEKFAVFGMGLLGLLTVQLLRANGCDVLAVDLNAGRLELARMLGAETVHVGEGGDPIRAAQDWTGGRGVDGAIITASAKTDEIVHQAAEASRKRGRIVLIGVVGLNLRRSDFYEKELTFQVSCSYGPGRYDERYEQDGQDYPLGYVRWTEQRNIEAILAAIARGGLQVDSLITDVFPFDDALAAYNMIQKDSGALGVILQYPEQVEHSSVQVIAQSTAEPVEGEVVTGVIGAGNYAVSTLLPALAKTPARLKHIADINGAAAQHAAQKFNVEQAVTEHRLILDDPQVQAVFILTGHHLHANMVCEALAAGKHVFVEKPLCIKPEELEQVENAVSQALDRLLLVGFNRRFSPHTIKIKQLLGSRTGPLSMTMTVNAGEIPADHWIQQMDKGGGRIIGEGCHFIDLLAFLAGSPVRKVSAMQVNGFATVYTDKMSVQLGFADGSIGVVNYFANGANDYPKEMLEVFCDGNVLRLRNFISTRGYGLKGFSKFKTSRQDKGHNAEVAAFIKAVQEGEDPVIPFDQLKNVTRASFAAMQSAAEQKTLAITE